MGFLSSYIIYPRGVNIYTHSFLASKVWKTVTTTDLAPEKESSFMLDWKLRKGAIEDHPMTIYLTKEQVKELGNPESIKVTITAV